MKRHFKSRGWRLETLRAHYFRKFKHKLTSLTVVFPIKRVFDTISNVCLLFVSIQLNSTQSIVESIKSTFIEKELRELSFQLIFFPIFGLFWGWICFEKAFLNPIKTESKSKTKWKIFIMSGMLLLFLIDLYSYCFNREKYNRVLIGSLNLNSKNSMSNKMFPKLWKRRKLFFFLRTIFDRIKILKINDQLTQIELFFRRITAF